MPLSELTAAELSQAAYAPLSFWQQNPQGTASTPLPSGWTAVSSLSRETTGDTDQFIAFTDGSTMAFVFRGTNTVPQLLGSDLTNSGGADWEAIKPLFDAALNSFDTDPNYAGLTAVTDGHSLGGGMAQTAGLENGLSVYGQNSLPISEDAVNNDLPPGETLEGAEASWAANGNTYNETNVSGDPATLAYSILGIVPGSAGYLPSSTQTLASPYAACEAEGAVEAAVGAAAGQPELTVEGVASAAVCADEAHSISTVISLLENQADTGDSAAVNSQLSSQAATIVDAAATDAPTLGANGITVTDSQGQQFSVSLGSANSSAASYVLNTNGSESQALTGVTSGTDQQYTTGGETAVVDDFSGPNSLDLTLSGDLAIGNSDTVNVSSEISGVVIDGSSNTIALAGNDSASIDGASNTLTATGPNSVYLAPDSASDTVNATDSQIQQGADGGVSLYGTGNTLNEGTNATAVVYDGGNTVNAEAGAVVDAFGNSDNLTLGDGTTGTLDVNDSTVNFDGTNEITSSVNLIGSNDLIYGGSYAQGLVTLGSDTSATVTGTGTLWVDGGPSDSITVDEGVNDLTITSDGSDIQQGGFTETAVVGTDNSLSMSSGGYAAVVGDSNQLSLDSDDTAAVDGNSNSVEFTSDTGSPSSLQITGTGNTVSTPSGASGAVTLGSDSSLEVEGAGEASVTAGSTDTIIVDSGATSYDDITSTGNAIQSGDGSTLELNGSDNTVTEGANGVVNLYGSGNSISATNAAVNLLGDSITDTISGTGISVEAGGFDDTEIVDGNSNDIFLNDAPEGQTLIANGNSDVLFLPGGDTEPYSVTLNGTGDELWTMAGNLNGAQGTVTLANDISVSVESGNSLNLVAGSGDSIYVWSDGIGASLESSGNQIEEGAYSSMAVGGSSNEVSTGNNDIADITGSLNDVTAGIDSTIEESGANEVDSGGSDIFDLASNTSASIDGDDDTVGVTSSSSDASLNGTGDDVTGTGGSVVLANGDSVTVNANGDSLDLGSSCQATLLGTGEDVSAGSDDLIFGGDATGIISGSDDAVGLNSASSVTLDGIGDDLTGSGGTATLATGDSVTLSGSSDALDLGSSCSATVDGTGDDVTGSGDDLTFGSNATGSVNGGNDGVDLGLGSNVLLNGSGDEVTGTGGSVTLDGGDSATITGNDNVMGTDVGLTLSDSAVVTVTGTEDTVSGGAALTIADTGSAISVEGTGDVYGSHDSISEGGVGDSSSEIVGNDDDMGVGYWVLDGTGDQLSGGPFRLISADSTVDVSASGDNDMVLAGNGDSASVDGVYDAVFLDGNSDSASFTNSNAYDISVIASGAGDAFHESGTYDRADVDGSGVTISEGASVDTLYAYGTDETVSASNDDFLTLEGVSGEASSGNKISLSSSDNLTLGSTVDSVITFTGGFGSSANQVDLGVGDQVELNGYTPGSGEDIQTSSGDIVDVAADEFVKIYGNDVKVVGSTGDTILVNGSADDVYADHSDVTLAGGDYAGDRVEGQYDTVDTSSGGSGAQFFVQVLGPYGGYGGGGYYGGGGTDDETDSTRNTSSIRVSGNSKVAGTGASLAVGEDIASIASRVAGSGITTTGASRPGSSGLQNVGTSDGSSTSSTGSSLLDAAIWDSEFVTRPGARNTAMQRGLLSGVAWGSGSLPLRTSSAAAVAQAMVSRSDGMSAGSPSVTSRVDQLIQAMATFSADLRSTGVTSPDEDDPSSAMLELTKPWMVKTGYERIGAHLS